MNRTMTITAAAVLVFGVATVASANPALLPKHEGYPMGKATDPVTGKALSNDPGQTNASGEKALRQSAQAAEGRKQELRNQNDQRILEKPGAGVLPKVQGPQIAIDPPVKSASKSAANPQ